MHVLRLVVFLLICTSSSYVLAHGGGLDANGCHTNRKTGDYHCHNGNAKISKKPKASTDSGDVKTAKRASRDSASAEGVLPPGCYIGPRGGTYTLTKSGGKNYGGC